MQCDEEPKVDDAIKKIAELLAAAYGRRARIRLIHPTAGSLQSGGLDKTQEKSVHELKLTDQRKGSTQS